MGQILAFITQNMSFISTVITAIETLVADLQNLHGASSLDAWAQAILHGIEAVFSGLGANTTPVNPAAQATIDNAKANLASTAQAAQVQTA